jgi:hypothetical protein
MTSRAKYREYLQSVWWWGRKERRLKVAGGQCEFYPVVHDDGAHVFHVDRCTETKQLEVHHKHYESLGAENDEDLAVLCRFHHLVRSVGRIVCEFCALELVGLTRMMQSIWFTRPWKNVGPRTSVST